MENMNILDIDKKIRDRITKEKEKETVYIIRLHSLEKSLKIDGLSVGIKINIKRSIEHIHSALYNIKNNTEYNFYIAQVAKLIHEYRQILATPQKISFIGKPKQKDNPRKDEIVNEFLKIAKNYTHIYGSEDKKDIGRICLECKSKKFDVLDDYVYICTECGMQDEEMNPIASSYTDIHRVNISTKYSYDRKVHFFEAIRQYQANVEIYIFILIYRLNTIILFKLLYYFFT